ncbi:septal ring lytic transglycosylase RlpA family protein [Breoghania sp. L-A4]|uniref:septal ring lytic transglycosylase RlpA family protein n=1 Tax=Breoghania sp. L-A4 TaxID=2304600 RepID=UPI000E35BB2D|nr:septal ring lytic transglycosylase RlpA family protein [Breoghania sp. L-A4]AXS42585.1 septal ring lytic transglycosylase RlpA family protein [Breoghania sp. L-A4]
MTDATEWEPVVSGANSVSKIVRSEGAVSSFRKAAGCAAIVAASILLASCASSPKVAKNKFDPKKYGVSGSPRMVAEGKPVPKGGGRYIVGKPYKIAGKWYKPSLDPDYDKVGRASWYGKTFHGRQTANGEVFDMNALTAAHTTMPLPSYARVTNTRNGRSVVVRVNDRGPFHGNREIDLSKRVAELLDFKQHGTANVRVQYVGKARLDGHDGEYLMASYRGPGSSDTMFAQADPRIIGPAPVPASRPYIADTDLVQVAFDPAVAFEAPSTRLAYAAEPQPMHDARGFVSRTQQTAFPATIQGGEQTLGYLPVSATSGSSRPAALSLFTAERRIDTAYTVLEGAIPGGVALGALARVK